MCQSAPERDRGGGADRSGQGSSHDAAEYGPAYRAEINLSSVEGEFVRFGEIQDRKRDTPLDTPLELEQLEMHIHRVGKLWLARTQRAKLDHLTGFGSWSAERRLAFGHGPIMTQAQLSCLPRVAGPAGLLPS